MILEFYRLSYLSVFFYIVTAMAIWSFFLYNLAPKKPRLWSFLIRVILVAWLLCVLWITLFSRSERIRQINFQPFYSYYEYFFEGQNESLRLIIMNMLLFFPGGLLLEEMSALAQGEVFKSIIKNTIVILMLSISIEMFQYTFCRGTTEIDDVINNFIGGFVGILFTHLIQFLCRRLSSFLNIHKKQ